MIAIIQFIQGIEETSIPKVELTRSPDGSTGTATFLFRNASILKIQKLNEGEVTGMYMIDEEGTLVTKNVNARFVNGIPTSIEALYIMRNVTNWDRFMRFMERYAKEKGLTFVKL